MKKDFLVFLALIMFVLGFSLPISALQDGGDELWDEYEDCLPDPACDTDDMYYIISDLIDEGCMDL